MKKIFLLKFLACAGVVSSPLFAITSCSQQTCVVVLYAGQDAHFADGKDFKVFTKVNVGTKLFSIPGIDEKPTKLDHDFVSWVDADQHPIDENFVVTGDITLQSKWLETGKIVKLRLHGNGGQFKTATGKVDELEIEANRGDNLHRILYEANISPRIYSAKKEDHKPMYFDYWSLSADSKERIAPDYVIPRGGIDLYANYFIPTLPSDISDEGVILLENNKIGQEQKSNALPINAEDKQNTLHVFGLGGYENGWRYQGNGSGRGFDAEVNPDKVQLIEALKKGGFKVDERLANHYLQSGITSKVPVTEDSKLNYKLCEIKPTCVQEWINETKTDSQGAAISVANDTALFVISRYGGEGNELPKFQYKITRDTSGQGSDVESYDYNHIYSHITDEEQASLNSVCEAGYKRVIVLINSTNPMEMGFLKGDATHKIDAALYMPTSGTQGPLTVPKILDGTVNPSGHLTDTVAYDFSTAPSFWNVSWTGEDGSNPFDDKYRIMPKRFLDENGEARKEWANYSAYQENIYIGYYWYETADAQGYWDDTTKYPAKYDSVVQYPFGYGKSYTNFEWSNPSAQIINGTDLNLNKNSEIQFEVTVTNKGSVAGKDVVQMYVEKPWDAQKTNQIEKPAVQLIGFAKTKLLKPNEHNRVVVRARLADFADYDCFDADRDGFFGYELEKGTYTFSLRKNAHEKPAQSFTKQAEVGFGQGGNMHFDKDIDTEQPVENLFTNYSYESEGKTYKTSNSDKHPQDGICRSIDGLDLNGQAPGIGITYLKRSNFAETFPTKTLTNVKLTDNDFEKTFKVLYPWDDYKGIVPKQGQPGNVVINDLFGKSYDDPLWDQLLDELTQDDLIKIVTDGGFGTKEIKRINMPKTIAKDGPCGFNTVDDTTCEDPSPTCYPSDTMIGSTWNIDLSHGMGKTMGYEGKWLNGNLTENYGPGLNIHRSPIGGRNFEYYSEDPCLSGNMCSWQISGAKEEGMTTYVKHFVLNDADTGRNGKYNFATEQTLREIYCKPYEIISKGATRYWLDENGTVKSQKALKANALMASVDRIGTTRVTGSYNLLTQILRNEWGFRGSVITDYYQSGDVNDVDEGVRVGNDLMLNGQDNCKFDDTTSKTFKYYVRQAAKNVLFTYIDSKYCGEIY